MTRVIERCQSGYGAGTTERPRLEWVGCGQTAGAVISMTIREKKQVNRRERKKERE